MTADIWSDFGELVLEPVVFCIIYKRVIEEIDFLCILHFLKFSTTSFDHIFGNGRIFRTLGETIWSGSLCDLFLAEAGIAVAAEMKQPEERTAEEKMALLGKPKLGEVFRAQIRIKESKEFKNTVDKLVQRANASILLGESFFFFSFRFKKFPRDFSQTCSRRSLNSFNFQFFAYFFKRPFFLR